MERLVVSVLRKINFSPVTYLERQLPLTGDLKVKVGEEVKPFTVIGEALLGRREERIDLAEFLGVAAEDIEKYLVKRVGEGFQVNEILARKRGFLGLGLKVLTAPFKGVLKSVIKETGEILLATVPDKFHLTAGAPGRVANLVPRQAVLLKISAVQVQGVWAEGVETEGELVVLSAGDEPLELSQISASLSGKIIVGGSFVSPEVIRKAMAVGVRGLVCGGANVLPEKFFEGAKLGFLLTEGFGAVPMLESTWHYLKSVEARAVVLLPERKVLLVPEKLPPSKGATESAFKELMEGDRVQILSWPHFGWVGVVTGGVKAKVFPSGVTASAVTVEVVGEEEVVEVPLRNVGVLV